jgi:DNA-binding transcriptional LysR family regulator
MTFKQLEALYWAVRLGSFAQAASKLHTTQSAVSKRIQELEALFATPLFDRSVRTARLTEKGDQLFIAAQRMLEQRDATIEALQRPEATELHLRIGVTELTAMTWLPRLVAAIHLQYPKVVIVPIVNTGVVLRDKLLDDDVDLMIVSDDFSDPRFISSHVGAVENAWMGDEYLLFSNSVLALIGLTISGLGISYLPKRCLAPLVESGTLQVLKVTPSLPDSNYSAFYRAEMPSPLMASISRLAKETCDFGRIFQLN